MPLFCGFSKSAIGGMAAPVMALTRGLKSKLSRIPQGNPAQSWENQAVDLRNGQTLSA